MIALKDKTNTVPAGGDYPYGDVKDDTGANNGTPVDRQLIGDLYRTVEKLMDEAGITANGLDDNEANGYQIFEAIRAASKPYKSIQGSFINGVFTEEYNDTGETVTFTADNSYQYYDFDITGSAYTGGKTHVLCSSKALEQGETILTVTGGRRVSSNKCRVTVMSFIGLSGTASGTNVGSSVYPDPVFVEIRIYP